jgi:hypothetical protein
LVHLEDCLKEHLEGGFPSDILNFDFRSIFT